MIDAATLSALKADCERAVLLRAYADDENQDELQAVRALSQLDRIAKNALEWMPALLEHIAELEGQLAEKGQ